MGFSGPHIGESASVTPQPRAIGAAHVAVGQVAGQTRLRDLRQSGALKLLFPRSKGTAAEAIAINTAGGITGGDRLHLTAEVGQGATLILTTQAAERAYRASSGTGQVNTHLTVADGGRVNWLPQETILFDHSALRRRLHVELEAGAEALIAEALVFGRRAMGEVLSRCAFDDRIALRRSGQLIYLDGTQLRDPAEMRASATGAGCGAAAQIVLASTAAVAAIDAVRGLLGATAGASLIADDLLAVRIVAEDGYALRQSLVPILEHLTDNALPTSWRL